MSPFTVSERTIPDAFTRWMSWFTAFSSIFSRPPDTVMSPCTVSTRTRPLVPSIDTSVWMPETVRSIQAGANRLMSIERVAARFEYPFTRRTSPSYLMTICSPPGASVRTRTAFLSQAFTFTSPAKFAIWSAVPFETAMVVSALPPSEMTVAAARARGTLIERCLLGLSCSFGGARELGRAAEQVDLPPHCLIQMVAHVGVLRVRLEGRPALADRGVDRHETLLERTDRGGIQVAPPGREKPAELLDVFHRRVGGLERGGGFRRHRNRGEVPLVAGPRNKVREASRERDHGHAGRGELGKRERDAPRRPRRRPHPRRARTPGVGRSGRGRGSPQARLDAHPDL